MTKRTLGRIERSPDLHRETVVLTAHQLIQIEQFSALALPAHPSSFARVVDAMAMEKEKRAHVLPGISFIQFADQFRTQCHQRTFFWRRLIANPADRRRSQNEYCGRGCRGNALRDFPPGRSTCFSLSSSVGMATRVTQSSGMPSEKSSLGRAIHRQQVGGQIIHQLNRRLGTGQQQNQHRKQNEHRRSRGGSQ